MALDYKTLYNKPKLTKKTDNGESEIYIDLLPNTTLPIVTAADNKCVVNKYYIARPDLISLAFYGTDEYADIICKVNGISNPFELNEDDLLSIPPEEKVRFYSSKSIKPSELISENSTINKTKKNSQKQLNQRRNPNEQVVGDSNYIIDKSLGLIFY